MRQETGEDGFMLLEVLVAFVILTLTLTVVYRSMSTSVSGIKLAREREAIISQAVTELEMARSFRTRWVDREGRYPDGIRWRLYREPMRVRQPVDHPTLVPMWLVYEAVSPSGKEIVKLRTAGRR